MILVKLPFVMTDTLADNGAERNALARNHFGRRLTSIQLMLAVALGVGLVLALNFSSRISLDRDLARIHAEFSREIESLLEVRQQLLAELEYVKSDSYVAYWARDEGKMIRDGEFLILPQTLGEAGSPPIPPRRLVDFETTRPEPDNWELWWALFFDGPPPIQ